MFASIAGVLAVVQVLPYIRASIRGETKPSRVASGISLTSNIVIAVSMLAAHAGAGLVLPMVFLVTGTITMVLAIKYGQTTITKTDISNAAIALLALGADLVFGAQVGLFAMPVAQLMASVTIFNKLRHNPGTEDRLSWALVFAACLLSVGSVLTQSGFDDGVMFATVLRFVTCSAIAGLAFIQPYQQRIIGFCHQVSQQVTAIHHHGDFALTA